MFRIFLTVFTVLALSLSAVAAKYKVNTKGNVTSPTGQIQNSSVLSNTPNFFNNYNSQNYIRTGQAYAQRIGTIDIVMDYSGSMYYWISEAKKSMSAIVSQLPQNTKIGFRVFGHNSGNNPYSPVLAKVKSVVKNNDGKYKVKTATSSYLGNISGTCAATKQVARIAAYNTADLLNGMNSVKTGGATPLTLALAQSVDIDFSQFDSHTPKKIILITDGGENCGGDPCAFAAELNKKRKDIVIDVVLVSSNSKKLQCVSDATGGKFYNPADLSSFNATLSESMSEQTNPVQNNIPQQKYEFIDN